MKLTIVNGSPRGRKSNSDRILEWVLSDINGTPGFSYEKVYVVDSKDGESQIEVLNCETLSDICYYSSCFFSS